MFAEFNRIATTNLHNDFFDAVDRYTPRFVTIFKSKKGSVGETLAKIVQQIDSGVSLLQAYYVFMYHGKLKNCVCTVTFECCIILSFICSLSTSRNQM